MSGKAAKAIRKLARKELEKHMNPQSQPGIQIIQFLENFIQLSIVLTGEKPTSLALVDAMYNAYIQESQRHAETLGLKPGFINDEPMFNGVKLTKKVSIIIPSEQDIITPKSVN